METPNLTRIRSEWKTKNKKKTKTNQKKKEQKDKSGHFLSLLCIFKTQFIFFQLPYFKEIVR